MTYVTAAAAVATTITVPFVTGAAVDLVGSMNCFFLFIHFSLINCSFTVEMHTDSPGIPASASAYELFRGFSFVAPVLLDDVTTVSHGKPHGPVNSSHGFNTSTDSNSSRVNTSSIISKCKGRTLSEYDFHETIGTGSFSICKRCVHLASSQEYAVKVGYFLHLYSSNI